jgi:hypothetical protein
LVRTDELDEAEQVQVKEEGRVGIEYLFVSCYSSMIVADAG